MKQLKNPRGFSAHHILLVLVIVGLVGFAGWVVWSKNQKQDSRTSQTATPAAASSQKPQQEKPVQASPAPADWLRYEGDGFQFSYPPVFKNFKDDKYYTANTQTAKSSESVENQPFAGVRGDFVLVTKQSLDAPITSRKYGPTIKLTDGLWKITEMNPADSGPYKVGDTYNDYIKTVSNGATVYAFRSADEGTVNWTLVFVAKGRLHSLDMPGFDLGTYGPNALDKARDEKPYNDLAAQVTKTITIK